MDIPSSKPPIVGDVDPDKDTLVTTSISNLKSDALKLDSPSLDPLDHLPPTDTEPELPSVTPVADVSSPIATDDEVDDPTLSTSTLPTPTVMAPAPEPDPEPEDPAKIAFIKTYTEKYDQAVERATAVAGQILDNIDAAIRDHSDNIAIPNEVVEFLDDKEAPESVEKFEDARAIVRTVMERAQTSRQDSEKAAQEASQIYDEVQQFKKQVRDEIEQLTNR